MSQRTDFHFAPPAPEPISGPEVLRQIELAFNELATGSSGDIDEVRVIAEEALETANNALSEATNAIQVANDAADTADRAEQKADQAITLVNQFDVRITNAQNRADEAYDLAANANTTAEAADTKATEAIEKVEALEPRVTTAEADIAALQAQIANLGVGTNSYIVSTTALDLNSYISTSEKIYTAEESTNTPDDLTSDFFFDAYPTSPLGHGFQTVRSNVDPAIVYARMFTSLENNYSSGSETLTISATTGGTEIASTDIGFEFSSTGYEVTSSNADFVLSLVESEQGKSSALLTAASLATPPYVISSGGVDLVSIDENGVGTILQEELAYSNGTLIISAASVTEEEGLTLIFLFEYTDVYTSTFGPWISVGSASEVDVNEIKDTVLGAITLTNATTDINLAIGINGRYFVANGAIANLPTSDGQTYGIEVITDTTKSKTVMQAVSNDKNVYYRDTTSQIDRSTGSTFYEIKAVSGTAEVSETLVFSSTANGLRLAGQLGTGGQFQIDESSSSGVVVSGAIDFYSDNTTFRTDGFTLTIQEIIGGSPTGPMIEVEFPALGAGDPVITTDTLATTNSTFKYQSGEQLNAGGSEASIYVTATWTNFTGTIEWSDWSQPRYTTVNDIGAVSTLVVSKSSPASYKITPGATLDITVDDMGDGVDKVTTLSIIPTETCTLTWIYSGVVDWKTDELLTIEAGTKAIINLWNCASVLQLQTSSITTV